MELLQIRTGGDRNFGYLLLDGGEAAILDPGEDPTQLLRALDASGCRLRTVIATHTHADHIASLSRIPHGQWELIASPFGSLVPTRAVTDPGLELDLGQARLRLLPTPGHTPCSLCALVLDASGRPTDVITGDTLFVGKVGGTGTSEQAAAEHHSLHRVLLSLPDEVRVWPGHDYGVAPSSTIGHERRSNPFLLQPDLAAFEHLKATWADYKKLHGIM